MFKARFALDPVLPASFALLAAACGAGEGGGGTATSSTAASSASAGVGGAGHGGSGGVGGSAQTDGGDSGAPIPKAIHHLVGRFDDSDPARPKASWSGTTFRTRVSGSSVSVSLGGAANVIFQAEIDGQPTGTFTTTGGDQKYEVASGLSAGEHDVVLVRRNEGFFGDVEFLGFEAGAGASLVETPWPYTHTLELIGDSLTAGYGIEGASASCSFSGATESFYGTYGAIAARNLNAAVHGIAYSGKGVFQNYGGSTSEPMREIWHRTLTDDPSSEWSFSRYWPEAVVVNLGTNDFSAPITESDFVGAYADLLADVRTAHPGAMIFCVTWTDWGSTREAWVEEAMTMTGDPNLRRVSFSVDQGDGLGCDYHTNLVTNAKLGALLTQVLQDQLGW